MLAEGLEAQTSRKTLQLFMPFRYLMPFLLLMIISWAASKTVVYPSKMNAKLGP